MMQGQFYIVRDERALAGAVEQVRSICPDHKKPMAVKVEPYKMNRTSLQNRYLWGWVYKQIAQVLENRGTVINCEDGREVPFTPDVLHEIFKGKFLILEVLEAKGKSLTLYKSTTDLNTAEFTEYMDSIKKFVYQFWKISVPEPHDGMYLQYAKELKLAA